MAGFIQALSANVSTTIASSVDITLTATPASNSLIAIASRLSGGGTVSGAGVGDTKGNTYRSKGSALVSTSTRAVLFWTTQDVAPLIAGDVITIAQTATGITGEAYEFSSGLILEDVTGGNTATSATSLICPSASMTPTFENELVISVLVHTTSATASGWAITNGFTINDSAVSSRIIASKVASVIGNQQATWSWTGAATSAAVMVTLQQGASDMGLLVTRTAVQRAANF